MTPDYDRRQVIRTARGEIACLDIGEGDPALFVHGLFMSSYLWRHVVAALAAERRCVAIDLPGHGRTPVAPGQDLSLTGLADVLAALCDALELPPVDLVGSDTGATICQVFAARHSARLRPMTVTNGEVEGAPPAPAARPLFEAALARRVAPLPRRASRRARAYEPRSIPTSSALAGCSTTQ